VKRGVIAVDTNVLLRRLLDDDERQAAKARKLFEGGAVVLITDIVLAETIWTLKGKRYGAQKADIVTVVMSLLEDPKVVFENQQAVWSALNDFVEARPVKTTTGTKMVDFVDSLVAYKAKAYAIDQGQGFDGFHTFDPVAREIVGMKAL
jgi:predicted nucleic-acid-binding protein